MIRGIHEKKRGDSTVNYIVLDLEWNCPFGSKMIEKPIRLEGEIVQIGAVKLDENLQVLDTFKIGVLPKYYTKMHKKITKLTRITTEDLQYGFPLPVAIKHFKKWCGDSFVFLTWGDCDILMLRANLMVHRLDTDWLPNTYNVQIIFDDQVTKEKRHVSLLYAMEKVGEQPREAHDALNDAQNTVCVCSHLDMEQGISEYTRLQKQLQEYQEVSSNEKQYDSRKDALKDPELFTLVCPQCGGSCTCEELTQQNSVKYISIARCENGDELFVRFKFKRSIDGKCRVFRIFYEMNEDNRKYYINKKHENEERRKAFLERVEAATAEMSISS